MKKRVFLSTLTSIIVAGTLAAASLGMVYSVTTDISPSPSPSPDPGPGPDPGPTPPGPTPVDPTVVPWQYLDIVEDYGEWKLRGFLRHTDLDLKKYKYLLIPAEVTTINPDAFGTWQDPRKHWHPRLWPRTHLRTPFPTANHWQHCFLRLQRAYHSRLLQLSPPFHPQLHLFLHLS